MKAIDFKALKNEATAVATKSAKSKIVWTQVLGALTILFATLGDQEVLNPAAAAFTSFVITIVLKKFASSSQIGNSGFSLDSGIFWLNIGGCIALIFDYAVDNQLLTMWGQDITTKLALTISTLNMVLRIFFTNQK